MELNPLDAYLGQWAAQRKIADDMGSGSETTAALP